jgi:hypothetical protein
MLDFGIPSTVIHPPIPMSEPPADDITSKSESCVVEHCYYAFDTLYCALTKSDPVNDKYFEEYLQGELCVISPSVMPYEITVGC